MLKRQLSTSRQRRLEIRMIEILDKASHYDDNSNTSEAIQALHSFYKIYSKLPTDKVYARRYFSHTSYISHLLKVKKALEAGLYCRACHEIISLLHYEPFLQKRIHENLVNLLTPYISEV